MLVFQAAKGEPTLVSHEKARTSGVTSEDLTLEIRDVGIGDDARAGVEVRVTGCAPPEERKASREKARRTDLHDRIVAFVARNPGCSGRQIRGASIEGARSANTVIDALAYLAGEGRLRRASGPRNGEAWYAAEVSP
ncbi:MAG: hypothetical protein IPM79_37435 [Polyangiaceae bacterium]|nr:hypothetical protein [Polyangiaceae bacterium]